LLVIDVFLCHSGEGRNPVGKNFFHGFKSIFFGKKSSEHTSARQPPVLRLKTLSSSPDQVGNDKRVGLIV
jgi:hypothetical protein